MDHERKSITEEDHIHDEWYKEAKGATMETLPEFLKKLTEDYAHDYGTVCHALAAGAIATCWAMDRTEYGGITGFQASCIMWQFIMNWMSYDAPLVLLNFENMLYPQHRDRFSPTISKSTWEWMREMANKRLSETGDIEPHPEVKRHWQSIVDGVIPFGWRLRGDDDE